MPFATVFADGTKQLMPNAGTEDAPAAKGTCYIAIGSREGGDGVSRAFARYNSDGTSCGEEDRLYIRIDDYTKEKIYLGFGGILSDGKATTINGNKFQYNGKNLTIKYRIKLCVNDDSDIVPAVDNGLTAAEKASGDQVVFTARDVPTSGSGYIKTYAEAYYGPNVLNSKGYSPIEVSVERNGLYYLEFYIGTDFGIKDGTPIDFEFFDVSVVKTENGTSKSIDGRVYSRSWGLNANGNSNEVWSTFYTYSTDHYTSKVYLCGVMPYRFVFCCNSFGAINTSTVEENRQSYPNPAGEIPVVHPNYIPEYKIFLTSPDTKFYGEPAMPNLPKKLSFAGDAMTCEDLIFVMELINREDATIELYLNEDASEDTIADKVLIDVLKSGEAASRGYHYPWKDRAEIKEAGTYFYIPEDGSSDIVACSRQYKLSLFDQRFVSGGKTYNIGDTITTEVVPSAIAWNEPLGSENNPILIRTKDDLIALANAVNNGTAYSYEINDFYLNATGQHSATFTIPNTNGFAGINFYLTAPTGTIILDDEWQGIGTTENPFQGTFRCGRYSPNPSADNDNPDHLRYAGDQDTIIFSNATCGLFVNCKNAVIDNIHIKGKITDETEGYFAGLCNYAEGTKFQNCSNAADISVEVSSTDYSYGGILGVGVNCYIDSCSNKGSIEAYDCDNVGGIAGSLTDGTVHFCHNNGTINARSYAGGIVGKMTGNGNNITNSKNIGSLNSEFISGGILGYFDNGTVTISDCCNTGTIASDDIATGMLGMKNSDNSQIIIKYCLNTGIIDGSGVEFAFDIEEDDKNVSYSISYGEIEKYITTTVSTATPSISTLGASHFFEDEGTFNLYGTNCCGKTWRTEEAGRLYQNDKLFYLAWDGKFDNGDCVVGDVTVNYQKNTGVTHFPFYDPENIKYDESKGWRGLVVYRIAPIADTVRGLLKDPIEQTEYQIANNITDPEYYGYENLPKDYYNTSTVTEERGYEMKLYWDDRKIKWDNKKCDQTEIKGYKIGRNVHYDATTTTSSTGSCISYGSKACAKKGAAIKVTENGTTKTKYPCVQWNWGYSAADCSKWYYPQVVTAACDTCYGIENVSVGGYYGSVAGGHIFPIGTTNSEGFGNKHIMNTWWNGIEAKGVNTLKLTELSPVILLPITLCRWTAQNQTNYVLLEWTTASEEGNNYFTIERSFDGANWETLGKVEGAGTTSMSHSYSFEDKNPLSGISYYRLKQTDFNGKSTYSSIKCINRPNDDVDNFIVYANEESNSFIVEGAEIAACPIEIHDILGHKITEISFYSLSTSKVAIDVTKISAGTYIVTICNKSKSAVKNW